MGTKAKPCCDTTSENVSDEKLEALTAAVKANRSYSATSKRENQHVGLARDASDKGYQGDQSSSGLAQAGGASASSSSSVNADAAQSQPLSPS